jgi:hypothetical protein
MSKPDTSDIIRKNGKFTKGHSGNPAGRPANIKTKAIQVKVAFMEAFDQLGGVKGLVEWANRNSNRAYFYRILAQLLPKDLDLGFQDELIEKYKEFTANELIEKSRELARKVLMREGEKESFKNIQTKA